MVQLMKSGSHRPERETTPCRDKLPVKLEIEDSLEEEHGPFNKRSKLSPSSQVCIFFFISLLFYFPLFWLPRKSRERKGFWGFRSVWELVCFQLSWILRFCFIDTVIYFILLFWQLIGLLGFGEAFFSYLS